MCRAHTNSLFTGSGIVVLHRAVSKSVAFTERMCVQRYKYTKKCVEMYRKTCSDSLIARVKVRLISKRDTFPGWHDVIQQPQVSHCLFLTSNFTPPHLRWDPTRVVQVCCWGVLRCSYSLRGAVSWTSYIYRNKNSMWRSVTHSCILPWLPMIGGR